MTELPIYLLFNNKIFSNTVLENMEIKVPYYVDGS